MKKTNACLQIFAFAAAIGASRLYGATIEPDVHAQLQQSATGKTYVIVILKDAAPPGATLAQARAAVRQVQQRVTANVGAADFTPVYQYSSFAAMAGHVNAAGVAKLGNDPDVLQIGVDGVGYAQLAESVPFIRADAVQAAGYTGAGITVAVLDSGIDTTHPDLSDNLAAGAYHFLAQGTNTGPGAQDDNGHGTNVAGIITSRGAVAPVGVAPDTDILAIKVLAANGGGFISDWAAGVNYVVQNRGNYSRLCAINMSLGSNLLYGASPCDNADASTQLLQAAIQAAWNAGIITFASSGNNGSCTSMTSPACLSAAVPVAAVYDPSNTGRQPAAGTYSGAYGASFGNCFDAAGTPDLITCFSNRSGCNLLAAPGRDITAPGLGGGLSTYTGTSQAAPHAAGVAALMCQKAVQQGIALPPADIRRMLLQTAVPTSDPCNTAPNPKRIDALAAITANGTSVPWFTIDCGGESTSTDGQYTIGGTAGQPDAGPTMAAAGYEITGGFWIPSPALGGLAGVGAIMPNPIAAGAGGTITVAVARAGNLPNNITSVIVDATAIGGAAAIALNDSGNNGDARADDDIWTANIVVAANTLPGVYNLPFTIVDAQNQMFNGSVPVTVAGGACACSGDMDGNGVVDGADINQYCQCVITGGVNCNCANITVVQFIAKLLAGGNNCP